MTITAIQASVTKTAVFTGSGVDISGITGDFTLHLRVSALSATDLAKVAFCFEDSVDAFTGKIARATQNFQGTLGQTYNQQDVVVSWRKRELKGIRAGVSSAVLRLNVVDLQGTSPSVTYEAWITS
jgi:hypothetical protein